MRVFLIHPDLMISNSALAGQFYTACKNELEEHVEVTIIKTKSVISSAHAGRDDAVIIFNREDHSYEPTLVTFLEEAIKAGAEVFPVAMTVHMRRPPQSLREVQSFDVSDQLRVRNLPETNIETVAIAFARIVISRLQPTLSLEQMRLFLSYRRIDGEEITAAFHQQFKARSEIAFRDLIDIKIGEDAQDKIEETLSQSDALVLLDTPRAGESEWIGREVETALALSIPVIWIRVGKVEGRVKLKIEPAATPHFDFTELDPSSTNLDPRLADQVLEMAFRISRENATRVFDQIRRIKAIAQRNDVNINELDRKNLLYSLLLPRKGFRYPQKPITHLVQFYGRWPKALDEDGFLKTIRTLGYVNDQPHSPFYDAALLLAPIPSQSFVIGDDQPCYVDSSEEYLSTVERYLLDLPSRIAKKGLIISGAFPDMQPEHQQHITDAVMSFVRATLDRNGVVIFGGHPTFTPLILDTARRRRPRDYRRAIHLYQSKFFLDDAKLRKLRNRAMIFAIEAVDDDRKASLSRMRQEMINDPRAAGLVAIGGRTKSGGHAPGIDEEMELARRAELPVFLIGSAGGRAAEICAELEAANWSPRLNHLSAEENNELLYSPDYRTLANKVLDAIKL